ncbi:MAG: discoidin domain-containing protein [Ruminococcaceae bacterium]|nr:discoidin domain-containing protein [Oscillospiraceae bacterium]
MKKILFCLTLCLAMLLLVACNGDKQEPDTTVGETTPITNPDTDGEATSAETEAEETTAETEETTEPETEYVPAFDPTVFEPVAVPSVNVAGEGYAIASNCKKDEGFSNLHLNDGNPTTAFSTAWNQTTSQTYEFFVILDLTKAYSVESIKLYPAVGDEAGFPTSFEVLTSEDGKTYTSLTTVEGATPSAEGYEVDLSHAETRYLKIATRELQPATEGKGCYLALGEVEVYASVDTAANAILNRDDIWLFKDPNTACKLDILYYRDGTAVDPDAELLFMTMDPSVAMVDSNGVVTPVGFGKTQVYVTDGKNQSVCRVEVVNPADDRFHVESFFNFVAARADHLVQALDLLKDAGIDYVGGRDAYDCLGNDMNAYAIFLCRERGMAYQAADPELLNVLPDIAHEELIRVVQKYEHRAGFYGIYLADEPVETNYRYAELVRVINEYNPHIEGYLNQFPITNNLTGDAHEKFTYQEIAAISGGNGRLNYISFDHYAYWDDFDPSIFRSLNVMRKAGLFYDCGTAYYLQAFWNRDLTPTENMYNASMGIAYGYKKYQWFLASCIFNPGSMTPGAMYEGVKAANAYIETIEPILGNSDAIEVYHTDKVIANEVLPSDFVFRHVSGGEAIYSLFEALDGSGKQHVVVTNKKDTADGVATFVIQVADGLRDLKLLDLSDGQMKPLTVGADGTITLTVNPGQCAVIELPDGFDASRPETVADNLALNKPAYVSSSGALYTLASSPAAHYMTDGDTKVMGWMAGELDQAPWIKLDLGEVCEISRVNVFMTQTRLIWNNCCRSFTISVSADGEAYTEVARVENHEWTKTAPMLALTFASQEARYVRIDLDPTAGIALGEIEVYN